MYQLIYIFVKMVVGGDDNDTHHQTTFETAWRLTLKCAKVAYFRIYDLRSTYATRL